jgi:serralysin
LGWPWGGSGGHGAGSGDVNGDGFGDLIAAGTHVDPHGENSGASYVIFGRGPDSARTRAGSAADQYISGGPFADTLIGRNGRDILEGRAGADDLAGGGRDTASYLHARARVEVSLANPAINAGEAAGDTFGSIKHLTGSRFADELTGDGSTNRLTGAAGPDLLTGGPGSDRFYYNALRDSPPGPGRRDKIADFNAGGPAYAADYINIVAIDAETGPGNQAFTFIGTAAFTGAKGELRLQKSGTSAIVKGDVDGDAAPDFEIELLNFPNLARLTEIDFFGAGPGAFESGD